MEKERNEELNVKDENTAPAENLTPTEDTLVSSYWDKLPYHLLLKVYGYQKDSDRVTMAQVCQAWYNSFKDPSLWRTREFYLDETNGEKIIHFASIFGSCLKNVEIVCPARPVKYEKYIQTTFENLMEKLEKAKLCRLELSDIEPDVYRRTNKFKEALTSSLVKLLKSQKTLKHVALIQLQLYNKHGTEVLKVLEESSAETLESLQLIGFFQAFVRFLEGDQLKFELLHKDIEKFNSLKEISLNFRCITEELIQSLTVDHRLKLECLTLHVMDYEKPSEGNFHKISSTAWRNLTKAFGKIQVNIYVYYFSRNLDMLEILTPGMPLNLLYMMTKIEKEQDLEMASIMKHLADNFNKKLISYKIVLPSIEDSVGKEIFRAFNRYRKMTAIRAPASAAIGVVTVLMNDVGDGQRKIQFLKRHDEGSSSSYPSQNEIKTVSDILRNIPNLKVEWAVEY